MTTYDTGTLRDTGLQEGQRLASNAKDEARTVADEARRQATTLLDQARSEVEQQAAGQRDRAVELLRSFSDDLEKLLAGDGGQDGLAADLARQAAERARELTHQLADRQPGAILDDVRGYARRRPGVFLVGALAAGVVVGRLARGAKDAESSSSSIPGQRAAGASESYDTALAQTGDAPAPMTGPGSGVTSPGDPLDAPLPGAATTASAGGVPAPEDPAGGPLR